MKVLVIGSGGREHALVWKIAQSKKVSKLFCAPGNGGIAELAQCVNIQAEDINGLLEFAVGNGIELTVVGPEIPLALGIVDVFQQHNLKIFGPAKAASQLESSKVFAKNIMKKYHVPTADFKTFRGKDEALAYVRQRQKPLVIKADGLCAGKGVFVCPQLLEQEQAIKAIMQDNVFGEAGKVIIVEEILRGEEASILVISDGKSVISLASSQDHKRIFDQDQGPNTGGMGAYSPAPVVTGTLLARIHKEIIIPTIEGMQKEGTPYCGVLYAGVMITETGPKALEFNVRFGDPETQAILPRLKTDLVEVMLKTQERRLNEIELSWRDEACVCVVIASGGYPGKYEKGRQIFGLDELKTEKDIVVFHAGTKKENGKIFTSGGRVLGVAGLGRDIKQAIDRTYAAVSKVRFDDLHYRRDIAYRALERINAG
ncbi:MAG: phosphoribosylamine--glycine ligase [Candidatus Omnitrophica bacterium]|nr:phosphoribosylamine--glycine ligase [Candidatus Omnitrophota bacterium]